MTTASLDGQNSPESTLTETPKYLWSHFDDRHQQESAAKLGMWLFLATEILMFSGLFLAYFFMRASYPEMVLEAHEYLDVGMGTINTVILITSSLTMALAVRSVQLGDNKKTQLMLFLTFLLSVGFLVVKFFEYKAKFEHGLLPGASFAAYVTDPATSITMVQEGWYGGIQMFFGVYFAMTGLHSVHVIIGMGLMLWLMRKNAKGDFSPAYNTPVENVGLYWHLVDLIWIFAFPLLYLVK